MITFSALIAITVGIVQVFKKAGLRSKYAPLISLGVGLIASWLGWLVDPYPVGEMILTGLVIGLSASGLYSSSKTLTEK